MKAERHSMEQTPFVDALTFLYHSFAHSTDGQISEEEQEAIIKKLLRWKLLHNAEELRDTIVRSHNWYRDCIRDNKLHDTINEMTDMLKMTEMPEGVRITVLNDLMDIAMADGSILETELKWIKSIADAWNIEVEI